MLLLGFACALLLLADVLRHPQLMGIMNVVWPVTALFAGPVSVWLYFRWGRLARDDIARAAMQRDEPMPSKQRTPRAVMIAKGALHCGSGCTLGDVFAEWLIVAVPALAGVFGWHWLFSEKIFAVWVLDYIVAFAFGVAFQYFTIKPMRDLTPAQGVIQAIKADALSLTAWQIGMYGFMAIAHFWLFGAVLGAKLETPTVEFWFMMQLAMLAGLATSFPVNAWLIRRGIKEAM